MKATKNEISDSAKVGGGEAGGKAVTVGVTGRDGVWYCQVWSQGRGGRSEG